MDNLFDMMIRHLLRVNGGIEDDLIHELRIKKEEFGDRGNSEKAMRAIHACLKEHLRKIESGEEQPAPIELSAEDKEYLERASKSVQEYLDEKGITCKEEQVRPELKNYDFCCGMDDAMVGMRIVIDAHLRVCSVVGHFPFIADSVYEYPLCKMLANENLTLRFGSFQYREATGEIRYAYSFLAMEDIPKDDLDIYVQCVLQASLNMFDKLRKYSSGHFDAAQTFFIFNQLKDLLQAMTDKERKKKYGKYHRDDSDEYHGEDYDEYRGDDEDDDTYRNDNYKDDEDNDDVEFGYDDGDDSDNEDDEDDAFDGGDWDALPLDEEMKWVLEKAFEEALDEDEEDEENDEF